MGGNSSIHFYTYPYYTFLLVQTLVIPKYAGCIFEPTRIRKVGQYLTGSYQTDHRLSVCCRSRYY